MRARMTGWVAAVWVAGAVGGGCASSGGGPDGSPDWVRRGCPSASGRICGVGIADKTITSPSMARSVAQGRGRTEIARSLQVRVKAMLKDHQSATTQADASFSEQYVEDTSKQITDLNLAGTRLEDAWTAADGSLYVLMVLDVQAFKDSLDQMQQLSEQVREAVKARADKAFNELDAATGP
jgi:hypothetical protein